MKTKKRQARIIKVNEFAKSYVNCYKFGRYLLLEKFKDVICYLSFF